MVALNKNDTASFSNLVETLQNCVQGHVLCVGDVMLDRYIYGKVDRISPEAPIPVLFMQRTLTSLGGVANPAANIVALGGKASLLGVIGNDQEGDETCQQVEKLLGQSDLIVEPNRTTTLKQRYISGTQQLLRVDNETILPIAKKTEDVLFSSFDRLLPDCQIVVLSDYAKGVLGDHVIARLIEAAKNTGKHVVVDPKGRDYSIYKGAYLVTPNRKELSEATGLPTESDQDIEIAARKIIETCSIFGVIATRGPQGMTIVTVDEIVHVPTHAKEVWDVSGAGDTVIATLAIALASGADLLTAARLSNYAAGVVVGKIGTAVATPNEIIQSLDHDDPGLKIENKFTTLESACEQVERWRSLGKKIGFTNGVFDLVHIGHLSSLRQSKKHCDYLVVGLNSDESVKRLKGDERPIQPLHVRGAVLAALEYVDLVVPFSDDTPYELVKALHPDVMVKGGQYKVEEIAGHDILRTYGGKIILADMEDGYSTTNTIAKMKSGMTQ